MKNKRRKIIFAVGIGVFLLLLSFSLSSRNGLSVGDTGYLNSPDGTDLYIAVTEGAYDAKLKALYADDRQGLINLMLASQLFTVPSGTPVRIIDSSYRRRKVRITSGPYVGLSGWVADEYTKK